MSSETAKAMTEVLWARMVVRNKDRYTAKAKLAHVNDRALPVLHITNYYCAAPNHYDEPIGLCVEQFSDGRTIVCLNMYVLFFGSLVDALDMLVTWEDVVAHPRNAELDRLNAQAILSQLTLTEQ